MSTAVVMSARGQFTLNKQLMEHLGVKGGDRVVIKKTADGALKISAAPKRTMSSMLGCLKKDIEEAGVGRPTDEEIEEGIRNGCVAGVRFE
jgi:bifunctional DNA-binding transcriptional regulator/antitoxin component of YhaV-PrlF toxin-antitoxin module